MFSYCTRATISIFLALFLTACGGSSSDENGESSSSSNSSSSTQYSPENLLDGTFNSSYIVRSISGESDYDTTGGLNVYSSDTALFEGQAVTSITQFLNTGVAETNLGRIEFHYSEDDEGNKRLAGFTMVDADITASTDSAEIIPETLKTGESGTYGTYSLSNGNETEINWSTSSDSNGNILLKIVSITRNGSGAQTLSDTYEWLLDENGQRVSVEISQIFSELDNNELKLSGTTNLKTNLEVCVDCRGGSTLTDTSTQLYFTWDEVPGAESYQLNQVSGTNDPADTIIANFPSNKFTWLNSGFDLGASYCFEMIATDYLGNKSASDEVCLTISNTDESENDSGLDTASGCIIDYGHNTTEWVCDNKKITFTPDATAVATLFIQTCLSGCDMSLKDARDYHVQETNWTGVKSQKWEFANVDGSWVWRNYYFGEANMEQQFSGNVQTAAYNELGFLYQSNAISDENYRVYDSIMNTNDPDTATERVDRNCQNGRNEVATYDLVAGMRSSISYPDVCPISYTKPEDPQWPVEGQALPTYNDDGSSSGGSGSEGSESGGNSSEALTCNSIWTGGTEDLKGTLQCQTACLYQNSDITAGKNASCLILNESGSTSSCSEVCSDTSDTENTQESSNSDSAITDNCKDIDDSRSEWWAGCYDSDGREHGLWRRYSYGIETGVREYVNGTNNGIYAIWNDEGKLRAAFTRSQETILSTVEYEGYYWSFFADSGVVDVLSFYDANGNRSHIWANFDNVSPPDVDIPEIPSIRTDLSWSWY